MVYARKLLASRSLSQNYFHYPVPVTWSCKQCLVDGCNSLRVQLSVKHIVVEDFLLDWSSRTPIYPHHPTTTTLLHQDKYTNLARMNRIAHRYQKGVVVFSDGTDDHFIREQGHTLIHFEAQTRKGCDDHSRRTTSPHQYILCHVFSLS